ncbi:MAG: excinuclease ABC subunit UvrA [Bacteroidales bacterium]|jgi:excinuclease ABC subunit A|nr:excinuclease ABC subunit UvrA [Bacteroidales bacterium]MDD3811578.1 excinuclease ABC subunit UvrA [Bacteroidales bacterium]MDD4811716.1 excinuclease ABC subunit UvrA [Bacteroidales bacterium]
MKQERLIEVTGARVHNLRNIDVVIPHNSLTVITGLSGSGKSSLAFDTIYAEGQRRYMETFSAYARQFLGNMERPDVDGITGLSPVIAIEQKTTSKNPRSTVGTTTEIYDFLRLLFARASDAFSFETEERMVRFTDEQILERILERFDNRKILILSPLIKSRKGHYKELFEQIRRKGYIYTRIDGKIAEVTPGMKLDRYKTHNIEVVIDRLVAGIGQERRLHDSINSAMKEGKGTILITGFEGEDPVFFSRHLMCPTTGISYEEPAPNSFSFNSPQGACPRCKGLGYIHEIDHSKIIPDDRISIRNGGIVPLGKYRQGMVFWQLEAIARKYGFSLDDQIRDIPEEALQIILLGSDESFKLENTPLGSSSNYFLSFDGIVTYISQQKDESTSKKANKWAEQFIRTGVCPDCGGARLKRESLFFRIDGKNIAELAEMDISKLLQWFTGLEERMSSTQRQIARDVLKEIRSRLQFLIDVGLEYLSLNRSTRSLSGGESQRIRLATQIGSRLVNVLYILDEPSIGLHHRDNLRLINALRQLRDLGNSVIVVEHDKDTILSADYVIDMGPHAGRHGGQVVMTGKPDDVAHSNSLTGEYLSGIKEIAIPTERRKGNGKKLQLAGARGHNLKDVSIEIPLGLLICVTGVSGSGKSSLINETLHPILSQAFYRSVQDPLPHDSFSGLEHIDKVIVVDQSPIGRTPRSNPATYTGVLGDIRTLFARLPESMVRGYQPGRFSFNVKGGRCETCQGAGVRTIEMNFLPDVYVPCETCNGKRFNRETLEVRYKGKSISDVLNMTINQALEFFENSPNIAQKIRTLQEVGLGYITLGQSSTTLSGGESQRVKLANELAKRDTGRTLYILDEPTTGLHFDDIRVLLGVLNRLVDKGNTVIVIEHNMEVIKVADYIIDLGPEGGARGGQIVATGSPEEIIQISGSYTSKYLKEALFSSKIQES